MSAEPRLVAGRYRLDERIGAGGMGVVWRAHDELLHRTVAVKQLVLGPGLSPEAAEEGRARAMREGRIAARLQHPHAINVFDVALGPDLEGGQDAQPWLVMEYLPSRSLADVLAEGPLPAREVARIGRQVADALAAAHREGIVHRDVKPGNVLIGENGTVKITDFGIARASWDVTVTRTGVLTGTPAYFAPEVARGEAPDPASDVFSLASTLYAAVEGVPPFGHEENTLALLRSIADGAVRPPVTSGPLSTLLMQMLRYDPDQRPVMSVTRDMLGRIAARENLEPTTSALPAATDTAPDRRTPNTPPPPAISVVAAPIPVTPEASEADIGPPDESPAPRPPAESDGESGVAPEPPDAAGTSASGAETAAREEASAAVAPQAPPAETGGDEEVAAAIAPAADVHHDPPTPPSDAEAVYATGEHVPPARTPAAEPKSATRVEEGDAAPAFEPSVSPMPAFRIDEDAPPRHVTRAGSPVAATRTGGEVPPARPGSAPPPRWWQRRRVLAGVTLLALLAIAAVVVLALNLGGPDDPSTAAGDTPTSASAPVTDASPSSEATTTSAEPAATTPVAPAAPGPAEFEQAVQEYYGLLPGDLDAAYAYLGPDVQEQARGRDGFERFWSQYSEVEAENVNAEGTTVTLTIVYTELDGSVVREPYILEMGTAEDGRVLILTSEYGGPG